MFYKLSPPFKPKDGCVLRVLWVARVSSRGDEKEDVCPLDDQLAALINFLMRTYAGPIEFVGIVDSKRAERLECDDRLLQLIRSGEFDLVLVEDLARIARRLQVLAIFELCADYEMRLIAINDHVDTAVLCWQDRLLGLSRHHERADSDG
jgi:DNA invertase Pin-like site-specific DNA recombinase